MDYPPAKPAHGSELEQPEIYTDRLILRRYNDSDAPALQSIINHPDVAKTTENIPHPYDIVMAHEWLSKLDNAWDNNQRYVYAIALPNSDQLIGTVSLTQIENDRANLAYWVGVEHWNQGYCTEAVKAFIKFIFNNTNIQMIYARHLKTNLASGSVLLNNQFTYIKDEKFDSSKGNQSYSYYELSR